jgi:hypothetical protein
MRNSTGRRGRRSVTGRIALFDAQAFGTSSDFAATEAHSVADLTACLRPTLPYGRLVISHLDEDGRTLTADA